MFHHDADGVARVVRGRIGDEEGVIAPVPGQFVIAENPGCAFGHGDVADLAGPGLARDLEALGLGPHPVGGAARGVVDGPHAAAHNLEIGGVEAQIAAIIHPGGNAIDGAH